VAGEGIIKFESSDPPFCNYTLIAEEHGDSLIIFRVWDKATGVLLGLKTINLSDENTCVRTSQGFTEEGKFRGVMIINVELVDRAIAILANFALNFRFSSVPASHHQTRINIL
jgi:hypothetical protein